MGHPICSVSRIAVEGEGEPEADHCVRDGDAGEDEDAEAGKENEAGVEAGAGCWRRRGGRRLRG